MNIPHKYQPPPHHENEILYVDDSLIIVNKPAGLLTVPGKGEDKQDSLISRVQEEFPEALIVHRLDMATSGLLMLARNKAIQGKIGNMFQAKQVKKEYLAVVSGQVKASHGVIKLPLITDWHNRPKQMVDFINGKPSVTLFEVLDRQANDATVLKLMPFTGRTHQLRVHMQFIGHAIVGDRLYGNTRDLEDSKRLLLHATRLQLNHPETSRSIDVSLAPDFLK